LRKTGQSQCRRQPQVRLGNSPGALSIARRVEIPGPRSPETRALRARILDQTR